MRDITSLSVLLTLSTTALANDASLQLGSSGHLNANASGVNVTATAGNLMLSAGGQTVATVHTDGRATVDSAQSQITLMLNAQGNVQTAGDQLRIQDTSSKVALMIGAGPTGTFIQASKPGVGYDQDTKLLLQPHGDVPVGIGTADPTKVTANGLHLHRSGQARMAVSSTSGNAAILIGNQDSFGVNGPATIVSANQKVYITAGTDWSDLYGGTFDFNKFSFDIPNTKMGIGVGHYPTATLDIESASGPNVRLTRTGFSNSLYFEADGTAGAMRNTGDGPLMFQTGGATTRFQVESTGASMPSGSLLSLSNSALVTTPSPTPGADPGGEFGGGNMLVNGGFEYAGSTGGDLTGWKRRTDLMYYGASGGCSAGNADIAVSTEGTSNPAFEGSRFATMYNCAAAYQEVKLAPGGTYTFSVRGRVRLNGVTGDASAGRLRVAYDHSGYQSAHQAASNCFANNIDSSPNLYKWYLCYLTFTAPNLDDTGVIKAQIFLESYGYTHSFQFDAAMLVPGRVVTGYADRAPVG